MSSTNWQNYPKYNTTCTCSNMQTVELSLRTWVQNSKHRQKSPSRPTQTWLMYHMGLKSINTAPSPYALLRCCYAFVVQFIVLYWTLSSEYTSQTMSPALLGMIHSAQLARR